jgi:hypothetical protein
VSERQARNDSKGLKRCWLVLAGNPCKNEQNDWPEKNLPVMSFRSRNGLDSAKLTGLTQVILVIGSEFSAVSAVFGNGFSRW